MTYEELEKIRKDINDSFKIEEYEYGVCLEHRYIKKKEFEKTTKYYNNYFTISIDKDKYHFKCSANCGAQCFDEGNFIIACMKLIQTPLKERKSEKKYYLKHKFMEGLYGSLYLNCRSDSERYFVDDKTEPDSYKTQFTEKEIEEIEAKGFDLRNFERIEVEE